MRILRISAIIFWCSVILASSSQITQAQQEHLAENPCCDSIFKGIAEPLDYVAQLIHINLKPSMTQTSVASEERRRVASPPGKSATQLGGKHDEREGYLDGSWIEIHYGRPIKRNRNIFGLSDYAEWLNDGAPVWRAGANTSTQLVTDVALEIDGTVIHPGEYTLFIELKDDPWTLIISSWPAQKTYDYENKEALFGAYYYTADKDVVRTPMQRATLDHSFDQLSWQFLDMTQTGGKIALLWDTAIASVQFTIAKQSTN